MPTSVVTANDALAKSAKILARQSWWHGFFYGVLTVGTPLVISKLINYELRVADLEAEVEQKNKKGGWHVV